MKRILARMNSSIQDKLSNIATIIETALYSYYCYSDNDCSDLIDAQRYGLLNGGKRIRAFLVLEFCRLFGGTVDAALPYACAIEMIHASSLIHDDLPCMDNDDIRRGKPSNHKVFGEAVALLAGDAMMAKAFETVITNPHLSAEKNAKAAHILAESTGDHGMLGGQAIDLRASVSKLDLDTVTRLHSLKTGQLICASAKLGCLAAGISEEDTRFMSAVEYAKNVGLAFQIIDDVLDYREGKYELNSFVSFISVEDALACAHNLTKSGIDAISPYDDGTFSALAEFLIKREY